RTLRTLPLLRLCPLVVVLGALATNAGAQQLKATQIATGLSNPIATRSAPGDVHRLFVVNRQGSILVIKDGLLLATPFLNIQSLVLMSGEGGLLGLAFHPDYAANGRFFVSFTSNP